MTKEHIFKSVSKYLFINDSQMKLSSDIFVYGFIFGLMLTSSSGLKNLKHVFPHISGIPSKCTLANAFVICYELDFTHEH